MSGRTCIVVDDGVVTGATARASGRGLRRLGSALNVLAAPVIAGGAEPGLRACYDAIVAVHRAAAMSSVHEWYERYEQILDRDVVAALRRDADEQSRERVAGG